MAATPQSQGNLNLPDVKGSNLYIGMNGMSKAW
jgi:hypothetical protein